MDFIVEAKKIDNYYWENINTKNKAILVDKITLKLHAAYQEGFQEARAKANMIAMNYIHPNACDKYGPCGCEDKIASRIRYMRMDR